MNQGNVVLLEERDGGDVQYVSDRRCRSRALRGAVTRAIAKHQVATRQCANLRREKLRGLTEVAETEKDEVVDGGLFCGQYACRSSRWRRD